MKSLRSLIGIVLAFALVAFAIPGIAGNKTFDLAATASVAVNQSITVTFTNRDDGSSSFNSLAITGAPGTGATLEITSASQTGSNKRGNYTISADKKSVTYTDLSPIKPTNPISVTLVVKTTTTACASGSIQWTGRAWTGSPSTPSNPFTTADSPTTVVNSGACTAQFVTQPKNTIIAQRITSTDYNPDATEVQVKLLSGTAAVANAWVDLTSACSPGALTLTGASVQTGTDGVAKFVALESSAAGAGCKLTATRRDVASVQAESGSFNVVNAVAKFSPVPTSVTVEAASNVTVKLVVDGSNPEQVIAQSGSGSLEVVSGACTADTTLKTTTNGVLTFSVQGVTVGSTCVLKATGQFGGIAFGNPFELVVTGVKVYTGVLSCNATPFDALAIPGYDPDDAWTFSASPATADGTEDTAFLVGARSNGDPTKDDCSKDINFAVTNFVPSGSGSGLDPLNNFVPDGGWSFTWDPTVPNPVVGIIVTFRSEWANSEGTSSNATWICTVTPCPGDRITNASAWKKLPYCLATLVTHSSIPAGESACLARLVETAIAAGDPAYCTGAPIPPQLPLCIQPTVYTIIGKDPVFIR